MELLRLYSSIVVGNGLFVRVRVYMQEMMAGGTWRVEMEETFRSFSGTKRQGKKDMSHWMQSDPAFNTDFHRFFKILPGASLGCREVMKSC